MSRTVNASAIGAIALPAWDVSRPAKRRRNSRSRSGASADLTLSRLGALAPVALEPEEAVPVRRGAVVRLDLVRVGRDDVGTSRGDERRLVHPVRHALGPGVHRLPERQVALDVVEHAEVGQREPRGSRRSVSSSVRSQRRGRPPAAASAERRSGRGDPDACSVAATASRPRGGTTRGAPHDRGWRRVETRGAVAATRMFPAGTGASSPQSASKESPYRRRALASSRVGSMRWGAPISETWTISAGCSRTSAPAAPAWSRWMCERRRRSGRGARRRAPPAPREAPEGSSSGRSRGARARPRSRRDTRRSAVDPRSGEGRAARATRPDATGTTTWGYPYPHHAHGGLASIGER